MSQLTKSCAWCLTEYTTYVSTSIYCCRKHKELARSYRKNRSKPNEVRATSQIVIDRKLVTPVVALACKLCDTPFVSVYLNQLYCSTRCSQRYRRQVILHDRIKYRDMRRTRTFKSNLYWKSQGNCGICQQPIDTTLAYPDPNSFSVDHIVPLSKGGSERNENLQAAHLFCNIAKGNRHD
jgi:5-methylcytosine-specific restriction endonuclease McrA